MQRSQVALDLNSNVKRSYRIFGPPATFYFDGQGVIRDIVLGLITSARIKEAVRKVGLAFSGERALIHDDPYPWHMTSYCIVANSFSQPH